MIRVFFILFSLILISGSAQAGYKKTTPPRGAVPFVPKPYSCSPCNPGYEDPYENEDYGDEEYDSEDYGNDYGNGNDGYNDGEKYDYEAEHNGNPHQGGPDLERQYQIALEETNGGCDLRENPHSLACTEWNYNGNSEFPLFLDVQNLWKNDWQGEWIAVTWVASENGDDAIFSMAVNPNSPTQPMGVVHSANGIEMGSVWIEGPRFRFDNWRGSEITSSKVRWSEDDDATVIFDMATGRGNRKVNHRFECRDFNRNDKHHLLCGWWVEDELRGYFGFLQRADWDEFLQAGVRR